MAGLATLFFIELGHDYKTFKEFSEPYGVQNNK